jgi:hypothetical protein
MPILGLLVLLQLISNSSHNTWKLLFKTDHNTFADGLILIMILTNFIKAVLFITRRKQFNISSNLLSYYVLLGTIALLISYRTQSLLFLMVSTLVLNEGVLFYLRRQRHGANYKQQVQAVVQAIKWAKCFSEEHRYTDPERLYLMGHSAGGHLATLSALDHSALTSVSCSPADLKVILKNLNNELFSDNGRGGGDFVPFSTDKCQMKSHLGVLKRENNMVFSVFQD